jgi:hypothetical protein
MTFSNLTYLDLIVSIAFLGALIFFLNPKLEKNRLWTATVTPLASIIGSGYLVSAPLLYFAVGDYAVLAMLGIVLLAYLIGSALRFNIRHVEPIIYNSARGTFHYFLLELERFSNLALSFAYIISVAFYLRLLSAFIFSGFFHRNELYENALTTAILLFIGISGFVKGLNFLEFLEKYAVAIKLSVIFSFLVALAVYDINHFQLKGEFKPFTFETFQILAGILLIVQGFETSKYLGEKYSLEERIKSMKLAQIISGIIYVTFIFLITPILYLLEGKPLDETAVIFLAGFISVVLGFLIRVGPLMSQFSAAVADTIGSGGLLHTETHGRISSRVGYLMVAAIDIVLVWSINIFEIIAYASKAFAFYYMLQTFIATAVAFHLRKYHIAVGFAILTVILMAITLLGKSAE